GTLVFLAVDGVARAVYALQDSLRKGAGEAVGMLHGLGLHTVLLSGDRQRAAGDVAAQLGMRQAIGGVLPTEKA
ncbi:HAD family hydrolase, partial [Salmonella enterica]|uniref:HAD family hydrolase n=1 Tax=Salmonella enterica TaxID=28901 RepID=UPI003CF28655